MRRCVLVCVSACVIAGAGSTAAALCQIPQSFICDGFVVLTVLLVIVSCLLTSFICILDVFYASCDSRVFCVYILLDIAVVVSKCFTTKVGLDPLDRPTATRKLAVRV